MEPEVREFLQKIVWSLFSVLFWLLINTLVGLKFGFAIIENEHLIGTVIFYTWLIVSFYFLFKLFKKLWKSHL